MHSPDRIIVVGASAGGVEALTAFSSTLPGGLNAAVLVVQHLSPNYVSHLPKLLGKESELPVTFATDGQTIEANRVFVAPPDHHLLVAKDQMSVTRGPKENRFRPSIDALFRSAAYCHGPAVIGIVLSGALDDGTSGLWSIKRLNGITMVQDPSEAAMLLNRMGEELSGSGQDKAAELFRHRERVATEQSRQLRDALLQRDGFSVESLTDNAKEEM